jgi:uncharacterized protein (UPF0332 family)
MDKAYEFMIEHNAPLEILTSRIDALFFQDYFVYNVTRHSVEVYSMEKEEIKRQLVKDIISLSEEYLESAKEVLDRNRIRLAIDAAYNAAELAAKALILLKQDDIPGSHGAVVSLFVQLYVKTNEVAPEKGRKLNVALKLRNEARYKPNALLTVENAQEVIGLAEGLIKIKKLFQKKLSYRRKRIVMFYTYIGIGIKRTVLFCTSLMELLREATRRLNKTC